MNPATQLRLWALTTLTLIASGGSHADGQQPPSQPPRHESVRLPDPRFRAPLGIWEIDRIATLVAKATGHRASGTIVVTGEVPLARIRGPLDGGEIHINPRAARSIPPNSWAFIIGHEFAHQTHSLGRHGQTDPEQEFAADVAGAEYAMQAGFDLAAHVAWTLATQPDRWSATHGSLPDRAKRLGSRFHVRPEAIRAHLTRYHTR